jgi:hypothetical protein
MDEAVPKTLVLPYVETDHAISTSPVYALEVKGVGEAGTIAWLWHECARNERYCVH